jgi:hypothetical protein
VTKAEIRHALDTLRAAVDDLVGASFGVPAEARAAAVA